MRFQTFEAARDAFRAHAPMMAQAGIVLPGVTSYLWEPARRDFTIAMDSLGMAMDAQPTLTTDVNNGVPAMLTTLIDPDVFEILFAPNKFAVIFGEERKGTWLDDTAMFPVVEQVGEVSSYGDFNENGHTGINTNWPQRQSYLFQTTKEYGERELERVGLARINFVSEIDKAAATVMNKFSNFTYAFGVQGLQNYGALNDPNLTASIAPAAKAYGGTKWIVAGVVVATANEIYNDILSMFAQLVSQTTGLVSMEDKLVLAMAPNVEVALGATNSFAVNVKALLKDNFPNLRVETAVQYGVTSTTNPQGIAAGNLVQMIAPQVEGQKTAYASYNEKMRAHPIIRAMSSFKQKVTGGTWGTIIRMPVAIASMVGV